LEWGREGGIGFMTTNDRNWQNRKNLSKTRYFDCSDVVNCSPNHSEFSLGRPMFGCGNWRKFYHEFEKFVAFVAIPRFKPVSYDGCKMNKRFYYVHKKIELFSLHYCEQCYCQFEDCTKNCCFYRFCMLLLIESCLFLEVSQKFEKQTVLLSITCLYIMSQRKCKNALLKCKSMLNNRQIFGLLILVHKSKTYSFLLELLLIWLLLTRLHCGALNSQ